MKLLPGQLDPRGLAGIVERAFGPAVLRDDPDAIRCIRHGAHHSAICYGRVMDPERTKLQLELVRRERRREGGRL